jgi:hypothetical protein
LQAGGLTGGKPTSPLRRGTSGWRGKLLA